MAPTASSSAPGVGTASGTGADSRIEGGGTFGRSADVLRRQPRRTPSVDSMRLNHGSTKHGPPGPPGLARRRPKVATVQRAAELLESRAVNYEHVVDRMNNAYRGDAAGPRVMRKSQLGQGTPAGGGSSPRKKSGGK